MTRPIHSRHAGSLPSIFLLYKVTNPHQIRLLRHTHRPTFDMHQRHRLQNCVSPRFQCRKYLCRCETHPAPTTAQVFCLPNHFDIHVRGHNELPTTVRYSPDIVSAEYRCSAHDRRPRVPKQLHQRPLPRAAYRRPSALQISPNLAFGAASLYPRQTSDLFGFVGKDLLSYNNIS